MGTQGPDAPVFDKVAVLGHAVWLMANSAPHKHLFIADMEWLVMPPVALEQFRIWREKNMPVAIATWAFLGPEQSERLKQGIKKLSPTDWKSGDELWLMDFIAPFGGQEEALKELKDAVFPGRTMKSLQPGPTGEMAVVEF